MRRVDKYTHGTEGGTARLPEWLRRPLATPGQAEAVTGLLGELRLNTVCQSAKCPNRGECFSSGTATFLIMGDACTRACRFCAVDSARPGPLDSDEPARVAEAAQRMSLQHVVVTTVTRDDLADGGAAHFAAVIRALREAVPKATVEVLTSDFCGRLENVDVVVRAEPDVYNHNVETVPRLYAEVRPQAQYERSLAVLARARQTAMQIAEDDDRRMEMPTKSGLMLGLGETHGEVIEVMADLRTAGVSMLTLGQYLRPSADHLPVSRFVEPSEFDEFEREARLMGFGSVASAPFVRSSYHAKEMTAGYSSTVSLSGGNSSVGSSE